MSEPCKRVVSLERLPKKDDEPYYRMAYFRMRKCEASLVGEVCDKCKEHENTGCKEKCCKWIKRTKESKDIRGHFGADGRFYVPKNLESVGEFPKFIREFPKPDKEIHKETYGEVLKSIKKKYETNGESPEPCEGIFVYIEEPGRRDGLHAKIRSCVHETGIKCMDCKKHEATKCEKKCCKAIRKRNGGTRGHIGHDGLEYVPLDV